MRMAKARKEYLPIIEGKQGDKAVEAVLQHFENEEVRHLFFEFYGDLEDMFDIISPDAFLREYLDDFDTLARMYAILKEAYESGILTIESFLGKWRIWCSSILKVGRSTETGSYGDK